MGNCWASSENKQTLSSTGNLTSGISQASQTTSLTSSNNVSSKFPFSSSTLGGEADGEREYPDGQILATPNLREFSFQELKAATKKFNPDCLLGEGGFGKVYKGWLDNKQPLKGGNGLVVAIKKLNPASVQGFQEWKSEVNFLGTLSHPNLVKLMGYCWEDKELLLVYEFMQRGSLDNHLFGRGSTVQPLPWSLRLKIAIGAARGLAFLHASEDRVIYRDMKAANILLDGSYKAKLSDFGLAKLGPPANKSHVTTRVMGSYGYAAPEYVNTGYLYVKSDVYGFGVVLLELLSGLRAFDSNRPSGKQFLVDWSKPYLLGEKKLKNIVDSRLEGKYPFKAAAAIAELVLECLAQDHRARPSMQEVLETLEKIEAMDEKLMTPKRSSIGITLRPHGNSRRNGVRSK